MDPGIRLKEARTAVEDGKYEDALNAYLWIHQHALEYNRAFSGVRLSYALDEWIALGALYPKALQALTDIRDEKSAVLRAGDGDFELFHDVASINEYLADELETARLYQVISALSPDLAQRCAHAALPALLAAGDFALARRHMPDPDESIRWQAPMLDRQIARIKCQPYSPAPHRWAVISNYAEEVRRTLTILRACGEHAEADRHRALALQLIQNPSVRREVAAGLVKPVKPPRFWRRSQGK